ncbi:MAG TPA: sensor histidine kinase [Firmicutes bacterium]|nr:sensor histidine kinase [Bacillota bacterium]
MNLIDCNGNQYAGGNQIPHELAMGIVSQVAVEEGSMAFLEPVGGNPSIIGARTIRKVRELSLAPLGTLIIRVDIEKIIQQLTYDTMENHKYLLITSGEKTVYSSFPDLDVSEGLVDDKENGGYQVVKVDGKSYFVVFNKSPFTNWLYTNILPYEDVFKQVIQMRRIVILIFGALFLITMLISLWMAGNLTKPMQKLINQMKLVESGEFEETMAQSLELERGDEIGTLQRKFLKMVKRIKNLIQENYTKQLLVKEAQLRALQAQINPHFLYNALESINWRAKINQQTEISQMIESLGNLLRNAMSDQQHLVTVKEELKLIQDYIHIQKVRFVSRLDFKIELDRRWEQLLIPKLILQPLVENAINHGLEQMIEPCTIRITATESGAFLFLKVEDNGPGIPPDLLRKLQMQETKPDNLGIGLKNIDERLKLVYGKEYGLTLTSQVGAGTRVMVKIPKEKVENV